MRRIKVTVLPSYDGPKAAIIDYQGQCLVIGDMFSLPHASGPIIKLELVMDAAASDTMDTTQPT